jgi:hypothetical protein
MRKTILGLSLLVVMFAGLPAYATDCTASSGSGSGGGVSWTDYSAENLSEQKTTWDCWSLDTTLSAATLNYLSTPGFEFRGNGTAQRVFTAPYSGHYEVQLWVELTDPHHSIYNQITAHVSLYHPGTGWSYYPIYYHDGTQGDASITSPYVDIYNVASGDSIYITISGSWSLDSDSHTRFSQVHLFNVSP